MASQQFSHLTRRIASSMACSGSSLLLSELSRAERGMILPSRGPLLPANPNPKDAGSETDDEYGSGFGREVGMLSTSIAEALHV